MSISFDASPQCENSSQFLYLASWSARYPVSKASKNKTIPGERVFSTLALSLEAVKAVRHKERAKKARPARKMPLAPSSRWPFSAMK